MSRSRRLTVVASLLLSVFAGQLLARPTPVRPEGRWVRAADLKPGDHLIDDEGRPVTVTSVSFVEETAPTYNLEVEGTHTYFVAAEQTGPAVWVHNACRADADKLIRDSEGRVGNKGVEGHPEDHIPVGRGTDPSKLALARPDKPITSVYGNASQAAEDLKEALTVHEKEIASLPNGERLKITHPTLRPRVGFVGQGGAAQARSAVFNQVTWVIDRLPDGELHLQTVIPE